MSGRASPSFAILVTSMLLNACAPTTYKAGPPNVDPSLTDTHLTAADGAKLPIRKWLPENSAPKAVLLAMHGFNDYSNYFKYNNIIYEI